jgi:hypothetical protein
VVTPDGPVILEANGPWDLIMVQIHGPGFLADHRIRSQLEAGGALLPNGSVARTAPHLMPYDLPRQPQRVLRALL